MKTSIIIPCYFASEFYIEMTERCIQSLHDYGRPEQVIIIDDGSPILAGAGLFDIDPLVRNEITRLNFNGGYAKAVNKGLKEVKRSAEVIIISNNDITFTPGWLEAILKPLKEGYDISSIRTSDNGYDTEDKITEDDKFGSLWAMKRKVYDTIGGLSEEFGRGYFEDLDYHKRADEAGFKVGKNHAHLVEHEAKSTFKAVDPDDGYYQEAADKYRQKYGVLD